MTKRLLVTGSSGLIGSEVATHFHEQGWAVHGIDNNQRAVFFGPAGDTRWNQERMLSALPRFTHHEIDNRDREGDQICSISDLAKIQSDYPHWQLQKSLDDIFTEIVRGWSER